MNTTTKKKTNTSHKKRTTRKPGITAKGAANRNVRRTQREQVHLCNAHAANYLSGCANESHGCDVCELLAQTAELNALALELAGFVRAQSYGYTAKELGNPSFIKTYDHPDNIKKAVALVHRCDHVFGEKAVFESSVRFTEGNAA